MTSTYSSDMRNLIMYLLTNPTRLKTVNDLMPMIGNVNFTKITVCVEFKWNSWHSDFYKYFFLQIFILGARFYAQLDAALTHNDIIEAELAKEIESARLFRLLTKLSTVVDRAELNGDFGWAEYGDRYMLKLFRDYVFHQVCIISFGWRTQLSSWVHYPKDIDKIGWRGSRQMGEKRDFEATL